MPTRSPEEAIAAFMPYVEDLVNALDIEIEHSELRLNRCSYTGAEERDDVFYVWVGLRGVTDGGDAGAILEALHAEWLEAGWTIRRYRHLPQGGVNLAATEPSSGNAFALDSGFEPDPDRYLVATLNTPCFGAGADVPFGQVRDGAL